MSQLGEMQRGANKDCRILAPEVTQRNSFSGGARHPVANGCPFADCQAAPGTGGLVSSGWPCHSECKAIQRGSAMTLSRRRFLHLTASAAAVSAAPPIARAQTYPARPVR